MCVKQLLPTAILILISFTTAAQNMAVNDDASAADNSAILDLKSTSKGLLVPRMTQAERTAISLPATGLLVYQTNGTAGFYYNSGTPASPVWVYNDVIGTNNVWLTTGNGSTTPGTNFLGTTNAQSLVIKTGGSAAANERVRFLATPQVVVNRTSSQAGDLFSVYGTGSSGAINSISNQTDFPVNAYSTGSFAGVYAENTGTGQGILGTNTSTGTGVYGLSNNVSGIGVFGYNQVAGIAISGLSTGGVAISGSTNGALVTGIRGFNQALTGTGIIGLGNNITTGTVLPAGSGLAANGTAAGIYSIGTNTSTGIGIMAGGSNITTINNTGQGEGVAGNGNIFGVSGYASAALANDRWGGYFDYLSSVNGYAFLGGRTGGTDYAILSGGSKSTMVKDEQGKNRIMYCTEAPEVLFQDFGTGKLVNGKAHIDMDPLFTRNIQVDDKHRLKVFIQLEGDCNGVYVSNKTATGFDVTELKNGTADIAFTWQVVANRADVKDANGVVLSSFADNRFPAGPERVAAVKSGAVTIQAPVEEPAKPLKGIAEIKK